MNDWSGIVDVVSGDKPFRVEVDTNSIKEELTKSAPFLIIGTFLLLSMAIVFSLALAKRLG